MYLAYFYAACLCISKTYRYCYYQQRANLYSDNTFEVCRWQLQFHQFCQHLPDNWRGKPNLIFLSLSISLTVATTFRILVMLFIPLIIHLFPNERAKNPVSCQYMVWYASCCTRICFDLNMTFLGNSRSCQMFNYRISNYDSTVLRWHWIRIWLICGGGLFWFVCWI